MGLPKHLRTNLVTSLMGCLVDLVTLFAFLAVLLSLCENLNLTFKKIFAPLPKFPKRHPNSAFLSNKFFYIYSLLFLYSRCVFIHCCCCERTYFLCDYMMKIIVCIQSKVENKSVLVFFCTHAD